MLLIYVAFAAGSVIKKVSTDGDVLGMTSVGDELYVLLSRESDQVAVYSINDYQLLRHLNLPGFKPGVCSENDITSCVVYRCLYVSDPTESCIHRYDASRTFGAKIKRAVLAGSRISKWPVRGGTPCGLSVAPSRNLLVTCQCRGESNKLIELSAYYNGQRVREIVLQSDIVDPWYSVQLTTGGQFAVCHGNLNSLHRVCVVGDDGKVTRSYGSQRGSGVGQLNCPCHLAVDKDSLLIFVADRTNDRIVLLNSTLEFVRYVGEDIYDPHRLYLPQATRRLFVGHWDNGFTVIET